MQRYNTKQRKMLLDFLKNYADKAFSASEIAEGFGGNISISAVYRNLSSLEKSGIIGRTANGGSKKVYYRYLTADKCRDHLHISCTRCGKTFHVDEKTTVEIIKSIKNSADFQIDSLATVFYGTCKNCNKKVGII